MVLAAVDELQDFLRRETGNVSRRLSGTVLAAMEGREGDREEQKVALAEVMGQSMALADLLGRRRLFLELQGKMAKSGIRMKRKWGSRYRPIIRMADRITPIVPRIPFDEAIANIIERTPIPAATGRAVAAIYQSRRNAFAIAGEMEKEVLKRTLNFISGSIREGKGRPAASAVIQKITGISRAHADVVYRNATNSAFTAGRFRQALDPEVAPIVPAFAYQAILDTDVRANHEALHFRSLGNGLLALTTDPIWRELAPPNGHNCRCSIRIVDRFELEAMLGPGRRLGLAVAPSGGRADTGFTGGRPDQRFYAA